MNTNVQIPNKTLIKAYKVIMYYQYNCNGQIFVSALSSQVETLFYSFYMMVLGAITWEVIRILTHSAQGNTAV